MLTPKVLIVNSHAATLLTIVNLLSDSSDASNYQLITARSGEEALQQVANHQFAVILLDVSMPGMDGFETVEAIHSLPDSASVPIIFITAQYADEMHQLKGYEKGAVDYLSVPVIPQILQTKVAVFVELAKKNLQLMHKSRELADLNHALQVQRAQDLQHIAERKVAEQALEQSREELRLLANHMERVKEDERKRIAREIHDDLGQNLLALRIDISMLHARTGATHPKLHARIDNVLNHIDATIRNMRAIINNLRPTALDLGLNAAIEWQVHEFQRRSGINCQLTMDKREINLDDSYATALFRILQESLSNVIRHARASCVNVELRKDGDLLVMTVSDNGIGVFPDCRRKANSFGLVGIKERVSTLGGEVAINTARDQGMTLMISIPMDKIVPATESSSDTDVIAMGGIATNKILPASKKVAKGAFKLRQKKSLAQPTQ